MIVLFNKPYGVLCQFTDRGDHSRRTLAEFGLPSGICATGHPGVVSKGQGHAPGDGVEPRRQHRRAPAHGRAAGHRPPATTSMRDIYPAGRLDYDSEGLVLLTDDGTLVHRITDPRRHWPKTYLVQVEGAPEQAALQQLRDGIELKEGRTRPAHARALDAAPAWLWPRDPPVRFRKTVPDAWIELILREGRNRQVRRMTAAVGLPTLRLIRTRIGEYALDGLAPGDMRVLDTMPGAESSRSALQPFTRKIRQ